MYMYVSTDTYIYIHICIDKYKPDTQRERERERTQRLPIHRDSDRTTRSTSQHKEIDHTAQWDRHNEEKSRSQRRRFDILYWTEQIFDFSRIYRSQNKRVIQSFTKYENKKGTSGYKT